MASEAAGEGTSSSQITGESSESTIEINIKTLESQTYTFRVDKNMPVHMLKEKIVDATSVPVEQQRLIFQGKVLKDEHLLSEYQLEDGHTLHLVARQPVQEQPTHGSNSEETARMNDSAASGPRPRIGQVSHSVVLGTVNVMDQGEGMIAADVGRIVGAFLSSLGVGSGNVQTTSASSQVSPGVETGAAQNPAARTQAGNPLHPGPTIPFPRISQLPPAVSLPRHMVVPDSLSTLSEFISRMELALPNGGSQSSPPRNVQDSPRSDRPSLDSRGLPTPEMLASVLERVRRLLSGNVAAALSHLAARLDMGGSTFDQILRSQVQTEAMHLGVTMQHLGAMLLELGRTTMTLHVRESLAESSVNSGPAVYISSTGPNPIMVQPSLQMIPQLGIYPPSLVPGVSGSLGTHDPSRNISIHIHAGTSVAPAVSSAGTRVNSGETVREEHTNAEQVSTNGNGSGNSTSLHGISPRTVVAAIPAGSSGESTSHVLNVIYPVQVRSNQPVSAHSGAAQGSHPTGISGSQLNVPTSVALTPPGSDTIPSLVAQINAQIAGLLASNGQGQNLATSSLQSADSQPSRPTMGSGPQLSTSIPLSQTPSEASTITTGVSEADACKGPESSGLDDNMVNCDAQRMLDSGAGESRSFPVSSLDPGSGIHGSEPQQLKSDDLQDTNPPDNVRNLASESSAISSMQGPTFHQASKSSSSTSFSETSDKRSDPTMNAYAPQSSQNNSHDSDKPTPLGLGLGHLQPKRWSKPLKPVGKDGISQVAPQINQNQQSIATGQQVLQSLASRSSETNRVNTDPFSRHQPPSISQAMGGMPLGGQVAPGQIDITSMMSNVLQNPAFNNMLTGVVEQTGVGSPANLRSMLEQCTRDPAMRSTLNEMMEQVGQAEDLPGMISGFGRGQGGLDLSSMIQRMMPVVSQALGRGSADSSLFHGANSGHQSRYDDGNSRGDNMLDYSNPQVNLQEAIERIDQNDSPTDVFRAVLESAAYLDGEVNDHGALTEELGNNGQLANEYTEMLRCHLRQRQQKDFKSEGK